MPQIVIWLRFVECSPASVYLCISAPCLCVSVSVSVFVYPSTHTRIQPEYCFTAIVSTVAWSNTRLPLGIVQLGSAEEKE